MDVVVAVDVDDVDVEWLVLVIWILFKRIGKISSAVICPLCNSAIVLPGSQPTSVQTSITHVHARNQRNAEEHT
jgi:hypothetical protein